MKPVAIMTLQENAIHVEITDKTLGEATETVYAWKTKDGKWVRIGTSLGPLKKRLCDYAKHINQSLDGKEKPTPKWEALRWKQILEDNVQLIAFAHQPPYVETIAGLVRPFLDIERALIREKRSQEKLLLNRSHR